MCFSDPAGTDQYPAHCQENLICCHRAEELCRFFGKKNRQLAAHHLTPATGETFSRSRYPRTVTITVVNTATLLALRCRPKDAAATRIVVTAVWTTPMLAGAVRKAAAIEVTAVAMVAMDAASAGVRFRPG